MKSIPYLISSILASEANTVAINTIFELVKPSDIGAKYGALYAMMMESWKRHKIIEPVALHVEIMSQYPDPKHHETLISQLDELWGLVASDMFWQHFLKLSLCEIKIDKLKQLGANLNSNSMTPKEIDSVLNESKSEICSIMDKYNMIERKDLSTITTGYLSDIDKQLTGEHDNRIITGLYYEKYIRGFSPGEFYILAGRPKMGKSAFANSIVAIALFAGKRVMLVNNEMSERLIQDRLYSAMFDFTVSELSEPKSMSEHKISQLFAAADDFRKLPLNLYCFKMRTITEIETEAIRLKEIGQAPELIVMDYLGLFRTGEKHKDMYAEITALSWQIKMLAANLQVPVLALAQVNRKCEDRTNKRPVASDLRESGALEQDATAVMFIYRDEVYNEKTQDIGIAEINVAINRNGRTGTDKYAVDFDHMKIKNLDMRIENA